MSESSFARYGREYLPGDVLFREGESGDVMFVIQSGAVRVSKSVAGEDKVLAVLGPGEFVGEMAILNGKPRNATATVVEPSRCLVVEARTLQAMLQRNSEIALRLIKKLAKRLDAANALVEILMHRDPKARVMLALARHAEAFGEETPEGIRVRTSPADIAREVDVDRETVDEVMARLRRLKLLADGPPAPAAIVVADMRRFIDFIEFLETPRKLGGES
ncbi:cyclic nucleotide-binding protein [Sorangium cellulosum]|uniref:Cyclic nucleotide-binding protein n=1 Tax=Sorangium cellulosum TaxID=56 RepID=A0A4P2PYL4_SORCE|nr:Crp/Fnr family transcriptional regulator [Sorangium cellulosum]AUX21967.1 cyclic nucleotide-binding protein [Sorangium cellulosum]